MGGGREEGKWEGDGEVGGRRVSGRGMVKWEGDGEVGGGWGSGREMGKMRNTVKSCFSELQGASHVH